jgi:hypothetical protein
MAMAGNVYRYDVVVPVSEINPAKQLNYFVVINGEEHVLFEDATRPAELDTLPLGIERYDRFMAHNRECEKLAWQVLQKAFPEIKDTPYGYFIDLPDFEASHATEYVEQAICEEPYAGKGSYPEVSK